MDEEEKPLLVRLVRNIGIALTIFVSEKRSKRERQMEKKNKKKKQIVFWWVPLDISVVLLRKRGQTCS